MKFHENILITVIGPTACGKTRFAALLADKINGVILSADSRQVYRRMNLGTGKDYNDYIVNGKKIDVRLIDIVEPGEKYNLFRFQQDFFKEYENVISEKKIPILCGGSGLYIDAIIRNYNLLPVPPNYELRKELENKSLEELEKILSTYKKLHNKTDTDTKKRAIRAIEIADFYSKKNIQSSLFPSLKVLNIGLKYEREELKKRIKDRLLKRIEEGMIEEVKSLLKNGLTYEDLIYYGLEYKYITLFLMGELDYKTMLEKLYIAICQFSKRQMTWFRKMERDGVKINWLNSENGYDHNIKIALELIENFFLKK